MTYKIDRQARCAVIGYGSWATALVKILLENESAVGWYIRNNEVLELSLIHILAMVFTGLRHFKH